MIRLTAKPFKNYSKNLNVHMEIVQTNEIETLSVSGEVPPNKLAKELSPYVKILKGTLKITKPKL